MGDEIFQATIISLALAGICVLIHYETLHFLQRQSLIPGHRRVIIGSVLGTLIAHVIEIYIFGGGYWVAVELLEHGWLIPEPRDAFDYVYFSAMVYTTVGFGDLVPDGPIRMIASTEALIGLAMITWSASFSYLQMQRFWRD
ncbi:MAG: two pore domain potassium channel family protein [Gammaproteobacteria bacterium]|jgi:hypothetical protein|nr:MAG: two pore domain potassium channel family protein [Gammaproteobacteria bacterium]